MPCTTVQKMIGAIIILTSLMKPSPSGLSDFPMSGLSSQRHPQQYGDQHLHIQNPVPRLAALVDRLKAGMTISESVPIWEKILHCVRSHVRIAVTNARNNFKMPT